MAVFQWIREGENTVLTGYCKMDEYKNISNPYNKKNIIIAPHHSIKGGFNDIIQLSKELDCITLPLLIWYPPSKLYQQIYFPF